MLSRTMSAEERRHVLTLTLASNHGELRRGGESTMGDLQLLETRTDNSFHVVLAAQADRRVAIEDPILAAGRV